MSRTRSDRGLAEPFECEHPAKDMERVLAKAEKQIGKLIEKVADQKEQIRELKAHAKHEENLAAEREELKAEIADLKGEIRELTRANREQVEKLHALRTEIMKAKADARTRKPNRLSAGAQLLSFQ